MRSLICGWMVAGAMLAGAWAEAAPVLDVPLPGGYLDVEYFAGAGSKTAYFVIDFGGNGGGTYAFGYRWSGTQTAEQALFAIDAAGALDFLTNNFGSPSEPNLFLTLVTYNGDSDNPDFDVDGRFWNYSLGTYAAQNVTWVPSDYGMSGREFSDFGNSNGTPNEILQVLGDGQFHGFYAGSAFPSYPTLPVAVPEPTGAMLLLLGAAGLSLRYLRRRCAAA